MHFLIAHLHVAAWTASFGNATLFGIRDEVWGRATSVIQKKISLSLHDYMYMRMLPKYIHVVYQNLMLFIALELCKHGRTRDFKITKNVTYDLWKQKYWFAIYNNDVTENDLEILETQLIFATYTCTYSWALYTYLRLIS